MALVITFLAAENENRQLQDLPQADFSRVPERFLLSVRTNPVTDNFVYWKLGPLFVFEVIQRMFSSWVRQRTLRFLFWVSILSFSFINKLFELNTRGEIPYLRAPMYYFLLFLFWSEWILSFSRKDLSHEQFSRRDLDNLGREVLAISFTNSNQFEFVGQVAGIIFWISDEKW